MKDRRLNDLIGGPGHEAARSVFRVVGPVAAGFGLLLMAIGIGSFFSTFNSFGNGGGDLGPPRYFWCAFLGMPVLFVGVVLCMAGYGAAVNRYMAGETAPVVKDTFNYLAHGTRGGVQDVAAAVGSGLAAGMAAGPERSAASCPGCGAATPSGARFCPACGASFAGQACASCGAATAAGARFCHHCGAPTRDEELA